MYKSTRSATHPIKAVLLTAALIAGAAHGDDSGIIDDYMKAFFAFDVKKLSEYYTEDAIFRDPTSEVWGEESAWNMDGKEQIMKKMNSFLSNYDEVTIQYNVKTRYESGGHHVFTGKSKVSYEKQGALETACVAVTSVVSVKDGKVVEHRDYYDYDNFKKIPGDQDC